MQKKIIALAIAGLASTAAFAQTNVTIYGIVDVAYLNSSVSGTSKSNQILGGGLSTSRIGFRGTEDLGNGLSAIFTLEYALANDQVGGGGALGASARQQFLGLTGGFGTVIAGGLQTPAFGLTAKYDALAASAFSPARTLRDGTIAINAAPGNGVFQVNTINPGARLNNAVAYVSPTIAGGLTGTIAYAIGGVSGDNINTKTNEQERTIGVTLEYATGPFGVAFVHHNTTNIGNPANAAADPSAKEYALMGSYDFGVVKLMANYQTSKFDSGVAGVKTENDKMWDVGAVVPVGKGNVHVGYARATDDSAGASDNARGWGVAYTYALSKRTTAYAGYNRVSNDSLSNLSTIGNTAAVANGKSARAYGFGLRHTF
jgi:predicted porin